MIASQPFLKCPRYKKCSVNNCPLSTKYPDGFTHQEDFETMCSLPKSYRQKVAGEYPGALKFRGLTSREFAAKKSWDNMPPEKKAESTLRIKKFSFTRVSQKDVEDLDLKGVATSPLQNGGNL